MDRMKLIIPHPDEYRLNPPPQLLWVKQHYCPILARSLSFNTIDKFMKFKKGTTLEPWSYVVCHMDGPLVCAYGDSWWGPTKTIFGEEMGTNELKILINFLQYVSPGSTRVTPRRITFKFDSDLYLIPYLFRATLKLLNGNWTYTIYSVDDRWNKMGDLGILPPDKNKWYHD